MNAKFLALAALLLGATLRAETPAPAAGSLDAAKRDLRDLPAAERSQEVLDKSSGVGAASLPILTLPGSGDASQSKPEPNAPPSTTWLQEALAQTDAVHDQHRPSSDPALGRDQANGYKTARASDPLAQYLGQWMTPRDRELLRPDSKNATDQKTNGSLDRYSQPSDKSAFSELPPEAPMVSILEPTQNPYLPEPEKTPLLASPFAAPVASTPASTNERSREPTGLAVAPPNKPSAGLDSPKPAASSLESPPISPTAPIVDDRKYFPQLHRF